MELEPFRAEMEVPKEACQEGISEVMGSGLHNISRALSAMTARGISGKPTMSRPRSAQAKESIFPDREAASERQIAGQGSDVTYGIVG